MGRSKASSVASMAGDIHLSPKRAPKWILEPQHRAWAREFLDLGFANLETFAIREMPDVLLEVYTHPDHPVVGIITQHPLAGILAEVDAYWPAGRGLTIANSAAVGNLDPMPGQTTLSLPGAGIGRLWKEMRKRLAPGGLSFTRESFPRFFEAWYRKEMEWRMRKGFNTEEVRRVAAASGDVHDEETLNLATDAMNGKAMPLDLEGLDPVSFEEAAAEVADNPLQPIDLNKPTGAMAKALRKAARGWPEFLDTWRSKPKSIKDSLVRVRVRKQGMEFYPWVRLTGAGKSVFTGRSAHAADFGPLKKNALVRFKADQVTDWAHLSQGVWHGHHTVKAIGDRMQRLSNQLETLVQKEDAKLARLIEKELASLLTGGKPAGKKKGRRTAVN